MSEYFEQAKAKLEAEAKSGRFDQYGKAMKESVMSALIDFCQQDSEFAQAIAQGGSFSDCMAAVSREVKNNAISDLAAYKAAVQFYFPGAGINMQMSIDLCASVNNAESAPAPDKGLVLDLSAFF